MQKGQTKQSQNQFVATEDRGLQGKGVDPSSLGKKAERSIWFIKKLILLGSGYNILPLMPSNRKSKTVQEHGIPRGGVNTKLVAPDKILGLCAALRTESCNANAILNFLEPN